MPARLIACACPAALALLFAAMPAQAQYRSYDWSGLYVGGTVGAAWSNLDSDDDAEPVLPIGDVASFSQTGESSDSNGGSSGSIEAGLNLQFGSLLLGVETDYGWFSIEESRQRNYEIGLLINPPVFATTDERISTDWVWTLRPRIGYANGPWLIYGTAGIASTEIEYAFSYTDNQIIPSTGLFEASDTKTGWTAGLGGAYMLTPELSLKGEWLYLDFGNIRVSGETSEGFAQITSEAEIDAHLLRIGMDYTF